MAIRVWELREDDRFHRGWIVVDTRANQLLSDRLSSEREAEAFIPWFDRVGVGLPMAERMSAWRDTQREEVIL